MTQYSLVSYGRMPFKIGVFLPLYQTLPRPKATILRRLGTRNIANTYGQHDPKGRAYPRPPQKRYPLGFFPFFV